MKVWERRGAETLTVTLIDGMRKQEVKAVGTAKNKSKIS